MLIAPDNEPVCESIDIIERIETIPGPRNLMDFNEEQQEKYSTLRAMHEAWDVEAFTIGFMFSQVFIIQTMFPLGLVKKNEQLLEVAKQNPELE